MKVYLICSSSNVELTSFITHALEQSGHSVHASSFIPASSAAERHAHIRSASVVVALMVDASASIYYELGLAFGAGKNTLIVGPPDNVPTDLAATPYIALTGDSFRDALAVSRRVQDFEAMVPPATDRLESAEATLRAACADESILEAISPQELERMVADLFRERGFSVTETHPQSDYQPDLIVTPPNDGDSILVEIKKQPKQSRVSVEAVRRLAASTLSRDRSQGLMVATSGFTAAASAFAALAPVAICTLGLLLDSKAGKDFVSKLIPPKK